MMTTEAVNTNKQDHLDYLVIGHITEDVTPEGKILGGTATYAALTARAFGLKVGLLTSCSPSLNLDLLAGISINSIPSDQNTTFENIQDGRKRTQYLHHLARSIDPSFIPPDWKKPKLLHLGPVAQEIPVEFIDSFQESIIGVTPQGWLRGWDQTKVVSYQKSSVFDWMISKANIVILSIEDINGDENSIDWMKKTVPILVVTEGEEGARIYRDGEMKRIFPPDKKVVDTTGAGDIFAAAFFSHFLHTGDAWESGWFATQVASQSVTRRGVFSIPTESEIQQYTFELMNTKKVL